MIFIVLLSFLLGLCQASRRYVIYYDQYHTNLTGLTSDITKGISHVILAFAPSTAFTGTHQNITLFESVQNVRSRFANHAKVMIAIGGWGDTSGFSAGAANTTSRETFARNVAMMLNQTGADGVDIDWEYPGGNGADYKQTPNSAKVSEITTFPLLLQSIRSAIGPHKLLSIAVPGLSRDMIAYTSATGPKIWPSVNFVNVMSYDLMNRRDNITKHHTDVASSLTAIKNYAAIGLKPKKMNLGFAMYAKWVAVNPASGCSINRALGCETRVLEDAKGNDTGLSGTVTFEASSFAPVPNPATLPTSTDGSCGASVGKKCPGGYCCSQYGFCGNTAAYCGLSCNEGYGLCPNGSSHSSFLRSQAANASRTDAVAGGQYYYDSQIDLFWTWDTPALVKRKLAQNVKCVGLGGVMVWSLGEDGYDFRLLEAVRHGVKGTKWSKYVW